MRDKDKDVGDQEQIREQRREAERGNGKPRSGQPPKRSGEQHGNGEHRSAPSAGGATRKQE